MPPRHPRHRRTTLRVGEGVQHASCALIDAPNNRAIDWAGQIRRETVELILLVDVRFSLRMLSRTERNPTRHRSMTQIISYLEPGAVFLASDRRLTRLDGGLHDDHVNKCVLYDNRVAFAFTGLAEFRGQPVHEWLAQQLGKAPATELGAAAEQVASAATSELRHLRWVPAQHRHVTFVGAGWARTESEAFALRIRISNRNTDGVVTTRFTVSHERCFADRRPTTMLRVDGRPMRDDVFDALLASLRHVRRRRGSIDAVSAAMVSAIRRSADFDSAVGRRVLTAIVPLPSLGQPIAALTLGQGDSPAELASFRYWEDGLWNGSAYGPTMVWPGGTTFRNLKAGPLVPPLGGLQCRDDGSFTVTFPLAAVLLPAGGPALLGNDAGWRGLVLYSDGLTLTFAAEGYLRGSRPFPIASMRELDDLLDQLPDKVDAALIDPDPTTLIPIRWLSRDQIRERAAAER